MVDPITALCGIAALVCFTPFVAECYRTKTPLLDFNKLFYVFKLMTSTRLFTLLGFPDPNNTQDLVDYEVARARTRLASRQREVVEQQVRTALNPEAASQLETLAAQAAEAGDSELALELLVAASGHRPDFNTPHPAGF